MNATNPKCCTFYYFPDLTTSGGRCVFPFIYKGSPYYDCINEPGGTTYPWCSMTDNYDRDKRRSDCISKYRLHYRDVIMGVMVSQITSLTIVYSTFIQAQFKENTKAPRHWPLWGEFTGDRWIPHVKGRWSGKCFHLMTSSWSYNMFMMYYVISPVISRFIWFIYPYPPGLLHWHRSSRTTMIPILVKSILRDQISKIIMD